MLLGVIVLIGWYRHDPTLIRLFPGSDGVSASTAFAFVLSGFALLLAESISRPLAKPVSATRSHAPAMLSAASALGLVILATLALIEWTGLLSPLLCPDPETTGRWLADTNPYPGKMRPLEAMGFLATGAAIYLLLHTPSKWASGLVLPLALFVVLLGLLGVIAPMVGLFSAYIEPVTVAGVGLMQSGTALFLLQSRYAPRDAWHRDDSRRIGLLAATIVVVTGMVGIIGGFGVLYPQMVGELETNLQLSLKQRRHALQAGILHGSRDAFHFAEELTGHLKSASPKGKGDTDVALAAKQHLTRYRSFGFSGASFRTAEGGEIAHEGAFVSDPEVAVPIHLPAKSELMWSNGLTLHMHIPVQHNGQMLGTLELERPLPMADELLDMARFGNTLDFPVCARHGANLQCFPFHSTGGRVIHDLPHTLHGKIISVAYGLQGKSGIVRTTDYRGIQVIAAYGPVGDIGLVANLEVDAAAFYDPIARRLWPLFFVLLSIAAASMLLLRFQVVPLVKRMKREIEERKRMQGILQESQTKLAEITANMCEGVYVLDKEGVVTFVNPEVERLLGWSAAELLGQRGHDIFHGRRPDGTVFPREECPLHQALQEGRPLRSSDECFVHKDGHFVPVTITSSPIYRNGQAEGVVGSFIDITQQKLVEQELQRYRDHLEQLVQERTCDLQKLNGELEAFSYSVSHDLRAPLRAINGYATAIQEDFAEQLPAEARHYLERVNGATLRMGELIDGLLTLSQVIRTEPALSEVDLSQIACGIAESIKESEPTREVVFHIQEGVIARSDSALMRVLLENLFLNAWKFTVPKQQGIVEFGYRTDGVYYVRDNGSGFDMRFAHKLFQPFERLHKPNEFTGNGIGLATVRRIVERHGGRVWAESEVGKGTTIYFSLRDAREKDRHEKPHLEARRFGSI